MMWGLRCPLKTHVLRFGSRVARDGIFKRRLVGGLQITKGMPFKKTVGGTLAPYFLFLFFSFLFLSYPDYR